MIETTCCQAVSARPERSMARPMARTREASTTLSAKLNKNCEQINLS